jgi:hypothetical protein
MKLFEITSKQWYHGTPDKRDLSNGFIQKYQNVQYISDIKKYEEYKNELKGKTSNDTDYFDILDKISNLKKYKKIPKATFFTNELTVAKSYADYKRAWDYQNAEPHIYNVSLDLGKSVSIDAKGNKFSNIPMEEILKHFSKDLIMTYLPELENKTRIKSDEILTLAHEAGYDSVIFNRVIDTYSGSGKVSTVAAVFDANRIKMI